MDRLNSRKGVDRLKTSLTVHTVSVFCLLFMFQRKNNDLILTYLFCFINFRHYCVKQSITDENLYLLTDARMEALDRSLSQLNLFDKKKTDAVWKFVNDIQTDPYTAALSTFSKIADKLIFR